MNDAASASISLSSMRTWVAAGVVAALVALGVAYLGQRSGPKLVVAYAGPTSGSAARSTINGVRLQLDAINRAGGLHGRQVVLELFDDENDPGQAKVVAQKIVDSKAVAVIGHATAACSAAAGEVYRRAGIVAVTPSATDASATSGNPWYFRTTYTDGDQAELVAHYLDHVLKVPKVVVVASGARGTFVADIASATFAGLGVPHQKMSVTSTASIDAMLEAATSDPTTAVLLSTRDADAVQLIRDLRDAGRDNVVVVTDALSSRAFATAFNAFPEERTNPGYYTNGVYVATPFIFDTGNRAAGELSRAYVRKHRQLPDWRVAFAHDASHVVTAGLGAIFAPEKLTFPSPAFARTSSSTSTFRMASSPPTSSFGSGTEKASTSKTSMS